MAQDFQDLTGQVIKKMMEVINEVESRLLQVLIDHSPKGAVPEAGAGLQNGPQVKPGLPSGVANQEQVDDLLESLGF
jgi:chemotaxis protein CheZ